MCPRAYRIKPACCNLSAPSVTPSRRTPSMLAISSCVITSSLPCRRSKLSNSQRHSCWSKRVVAVAHRRLRHLGYQRLGVAQQQMQHRTRSIELLFHQLRFQPKPLTGALHHRTAGGRLSAHEQGNADDALIADHGNLCRGAVLHDIQQRDDGGRWKIDVAQRSARLVKHLAQRQVDGFQERQPALRLCIRQRGEQVVFYSLRRKNFHRTPRGISTS